MCYVINTEETRLADRAKTRKVCVDGAGPTNEYVDNFKSIMEI